MTWLDRLLGRTPAESREKAVQRPREVRNYTDSLTALYEAQVAGSAGSGDIMVTAAAESAIGLWGRALGAATVVPDDRGLTPKVLAQVGRELVRRGESVWRIVVSDGGVMLRPACAWQVHGQSTEESSWMYELTEAAPDNSIVTTVRADEVLHFRTGVSPEAPWRGRSPLSRASMSSSLVGWLEARGRDEASATTGRLIPVPSTQNLGGVEQELASIGGKTVLVPTTQQSWDGRGTTGSPTPQSEWTPRRVGAEPPQSLVQLRMDAIRSIWQACGVPAGLLEGSDGTGLREMTRAFIHATLNPVLREMEVEASAKLDRDVKFSLEALGATDLAGRSRAMGSLVTAGMKPEKAAEVTGFMTTAADFREPAGTQNTNDSG